MAQTYLARDLFAEFDRLQREVSNLFDNSPSIRGFSRGGFPALNIATSPDSVEIYAFAPGVDPTALRVDLERGVLTLDGERRVEATESDPKHALHLQERFSGRFRRVVSLPDDVDSDAISARYSDGVLHISAKRRESARPRRVTVA